LEGFGVGLVAVEGGIEDHLGIHTTAVRVDESVDCGGIGEFVHRHAYRAGRAANQTDNG